MSWKLSPEQRREIARLYITERMSTTTLGSMFGISQGHVSRVLKDEGVTARVGKPPKYDPGAVKVCEACGNEFSRKVMGNRKMEKPSQFARRTTCSKECRYTVVGDKNGARADRLPWTVGRRILLAKTCPACGCFLPASRFQLQGRGFYATTCSRCVQKEWIDAIEPERRTAILQKRGLDTKRKNVESRPTAWRHGDQWTGPELELVARRDLPAAKVAKMVGRTIYAVRGQRRLLDKGDPKQTALAGVSRDHPSNPNAVNKPTA